MGGLFSYGQEKKEEEIKPPAQKKAEI